MAVKEGVTAIPDSDEEPMTSSPVEASHKLHAAPHRALQASSQGASRGVANEGQAPVAGLSHTASQQRESLVDDQEKCLMQNVPTDAQVANKSQQQHVDVEVPSALGETLPGLKTPNAGPGPPRMDSQAQARDEAVEGLRSVPGVHSSASEPTRSGMPTAELPGIIASATAASELQMATDNSQSERLWGPQIPSREVPTQTIPQLLETIAPSPQATDGNTLPETEHLAARRNPTLEQAHREIKTLYHTTSPVPPKYPEMTVEGEVPVADDSLGHMEVDFDLSKSAAANPALGVNSTGATLPNRKGDQAASAEEISLPRVSVERIAPMVTEQNENRNDRVGVPVISSREETEAPHGRSTQGSSLQGVNVAVDPQASSATEQNEKHNGPKNIDITTSGEKQPDLQERSPKRIAVQKVSGTVETPKLETEGLRMAIDPPNLQKDTRASIKPVPKPPSPAKTSQVATLAELKAQRTALIAALAALPNMQALVAENSPSSIPSQPPDSEPTNADIMDIANKVVKKHIKLLHEYNEIKDVGQGLMGLIADQRGVRIVEVQDEFGVGAKD